MTDTTPTNQSFRDFTGIGRDINTDGGDVSINFISRQSEDVIRNRRLIEGSPYLGLEKFQVEDNDKFFGRDRWIIELKNYFQNHNFLFLLGASGSGKSSLIQAGLIPALKNQLGATKLVNLTFVPDVNPFESFYGCLLTKYGQSKAKTAQAVNIDTLMQVVQTLKQDDQSWLIFIDQFEELFTRTPKQERDIFIHSLVQLAEKLDSSVKIILTMRADFLDKLSPYPQLGKIHDSYSRMLTDMDDSELRLAIAEPAARNGVIYEQGLIEQIIADFHQQAGSLPLLQYTLDLLWKNGKIQDRVLNITTYQEIGGVTGALQKQADHIYQQFAEPERQAADQIFLELIELADKKPVSRRADKSSFGEGTISATVLEQLIDNRLLVSKGEGGKATVEVAHEALLRSWKVLQDLIRDKEEIIVLRNRLYADAKQWDELRQTDLQKASGDLWSGSKLTRIVEMQKQQSLPNLDGVAMQFIAASLEQQERQEKEQEARRQREIRTAWGIAGGSLVAVMVSAGLGLMAWHNAKQAELNKANSLGRYSLSLLDTDKNLDGLIAAIQAGRNLQKQNATDWLVTAALREAVDRVRERNRLVRHSYLVDSISYSPDGKTLASGSGDNSIKLWDIASGKEIRTLTGHSDVVNSVSYSPDGKTLASRSGDKSIKLWDISSGKEIRTLNGHSSLVNSISYSPDGKTLAFGSGDNSIKLWDIASGKEIRTLTGHSDVVNSVSYSPDGKTLASGSFDNSIKLWDISSGKEIRTLNGHSSLVNSISYSPDGKTLASGSRDKSIKLWDISSGKEIRTLTGHSDAVNSVSYSPDGKTLASGSWDNSIKLWDIASGKEIRTLNGHSEGVNSVSYSPDGKTLASGSLDNSIKLWDIASGKELRTLTGHSDGIYSVSYSPDGKTLASGSLDNSIKLWDIVSGKELRTLTGHSSWVHSVSYSPDGKTLASGSVDDSIKLWDIASGKEIRTLTGHSDGIYSVSYSPDGKTLASGSFDNSIKLWDIARGKEIRTLTGHSSLVKSVSFSPDGKTLASGSFDNSIKLWDIASGKELRTLTGHRDRVNSVSYSPDGKTLASSSFDNSIKLWDIASGKEIRTLTGHSDVVYSVSYSPDGKTLASGSKSIKLWDIAIGKELRTLNGHSGSVISVSFSPDGKTLASGSGDSNIILWNLDLDDLLLRGCSWLDAYLHNPDSDASDSDRHLCDGIDTKK